jgi:hypothetical protein
MSATVLEEATNYGRRGLWVHPLRPGTKLPILDRLPARAVRLESGWLLTVWLEEHEDVRDRVLTDCRGAV